MRQLEENQTGIIADKHSPDVNDIIRIIRGPLTHDDWFPKKDANFLCYYPGLFGWRVVSYYELLCDLISSDGVTAWAVLPKMEE